MPLREIDQPLGQNIPSGSGFLKLSWRFWVLIFLFFIALVTVLSVFFFKSAPLFSSKKQKLKNSLPFDSLSKKLEKKEEKKDDGFLVYDPLSTSIDPSAELSHLPDKDLIETTSFGLLPVVAEDGKRPFDAYARPFLSSGSPKIALIIGGLGVSQTGTLQAISALPSDITLAFASRGNSLDRWMQKARREGHEILIQAPLEPFNYPDVNPGEKTLTVEGSEKTNKENLGWALSRTTNYIGLMNYMGARFLSNPSSLDFLMKELGERGLFFLDDGTFPQSLASDFALKNHVPFAKADLVIDDISDPSSIEEKLRYLEDIARKKGFAIGAGSAFNKTIEAVSVWAEGLSSRHIQLAPVSALAQELE